MKTIIEVGGNQGQHTSQFVKPDTRVFVFEPVFELYSKLWVRYKDNPNVHILPFAIDEEQTTKTFNVAGQNDWGCSSLNEFSDNLNTTWPGRTDFKITHKYSVLTLRLDSFCSIYNIDSIDYLWIDAQGHDFKVLRSLGDRLATVKEGRCEAAMEVNLYKNTDNQYSSIVKYLDERNFNTVVKPDTSGIKAECDVIFSRK